MPHGSAHNQEERDASTVGPRAYRVEPYGVQQAVSQDTFKEIRRDEYPGHGACRVQRLV